MVKFLEGPTDLYLAGTLFCRWGRLGAGKLPVVALVSLAVAASMRGGLGMVEVSVPFAASVRGGLDEFDLSLPFAASVRGGLGEFDLSLPVPAIVLGGLLTITNSGVGSTTPGSSDFWPGVVSGPLLVSVVAGRASG